MLKTVSSITNAIGALNFKGTWDANANSPALASSVGTKGDYYVVGTAGSTTLNGISNWGVGDWATYNGSVWQRVEGGADLNGVNLSVSGTTTLSGLTASTALALDASKNVVSLTQPAFSAYLSANQATTINAFTKILIDTEEFDIGNGFDTGTSRFQPTVAGYYQVTAEVVMASGVGFVYPAIYKNGAIAKGGNTTTVNAVNTSANVTALIYMNGSTDYLEFFIFQNAGVGLLAIAGAANTYFQAAYIRG
jgi:hypothetical protein